MKGAVSVEPRLAGDAAGEGQMLRDGDTCSEVHLVRSLALKSRVRNHGVVLLDVESDETFDGGERVEVVEEEPVVLEGAPPSLDHRIPEGDFHLSEDAAEMPEAEEFIDVAVDVLDAESATTVAAFELRSAPAAAAERTAQVVCGSSRPASFQARMRREKLSITACR